MAEYTRPATWDDVKKLAKLLNEAGVEYALVGGYAIAAHGSKDQMDAALLSTALHELKKR